MVQWQGKAALATVLGVMFSTIDVQSKLNQSLVEPLHPNTMLMLMAADFLIPVATVFYVLYKSDWK